MSYAQISCEILESSLIPAASICRFGIQYQILGLGFIFDRTDHQIARTSDPESGKKKHQLGSKFNSFPPVCKYTKSLATKEHQFIVIPLNKRDNPHILLDVTARALLYSII